jgi:hypothetical protein
VEEETMKQDETMSVVESCNKKTCTLKRIEELEDTDDPLHVILTEQNLHDDRANESEPEDEKDNSDEYNSEENSSDDSKNECQAELVMMMMMIFFFYLLLMITLELVQLLRKGKNVRGIMYSLNESMKPVTENVRKSIRDIIDCLKDFVKYIEEHVDKNRRDIIDFLNENVKYMEGNIENLQNVRNGRN